jgi:(R,R)-butanediol dehydrogenase / meso-butanediol dehydrogenase / diacetyl reductase
MRAAVFEGDGKVSVLDRPQPVADRPDDVVIRIAANGLCGSDLRAFATPPQMAYEEGVIVGHEFSGVVAAVGSDVRSLSEGARVVAIPNINCQVCWYCRAGHTNLCENFVHIGSMRDGGAADFCVVPERMVLQVPDSVSDDLATLAEPLACVLNGTRTAGAQPGDTVLILGGGPIGLLYVLLMKAAGARVIVSEPAAQRANAAREFGANEVVDPTERPLAGAVRELTSRGVDIAVDTVGSVLTDAVESVRKGGRVLVFGLNDRARPALGEANLSYRELSIEGVYIAKGTFPLALTLLEQNELGFERLITHRLELERFWEAVELARSGAAIKAIVVP